MNTEPITNMALLFEQFFLTMRASRYSEQTVAKYETIARLFQKYIGSATIDQIGVATIRGYFAALTCGKKTALNYHTTLSAFWRWCVKNGYASENIVRQAVYIKKPAEVEIIPYTQNDLRDLLKAAEASSDPLRNRAMVLMLLDTGIRASELCAVILHDVYWVTQKIMVRHGKGDKQRILKISDRTYTALIEYLDSRGITVREGPTPLFATNKKAPLTRGRVGKIIAALGRESGVTDAHPHRFRHTFAIQFLRNGGNIYTLQKLLGHTTLEMCRRYLSLSQADLDSNMDRASPVMNWSL